MSWTLTLLLVLLLGILYTTGKFFTSYNNKVFFDMIKDLGGPKYFHTCPDLAMVYYHTQDLGKYLPKAFHSSIKSADRLLQTLWGIENGLDPPESGEESIARSNAAVTSLKSITTRKSLEECQLLLNQTLNYFHGLQVKVPWKLKPRVSRAECEIKRLLSEKIRSFHVKYNVLLSSRANGETFKSIWDYHRTSVLELDKVFRHWKDQGEVSRD